MRIKIDREKCLGCGLCEGICGGIFQIGDDGKAYVKNPYLIIYCVKKAVEECPADAITMEKETLTKKWC
jgi:ferredoxin